MKIAVFIDEDLNLCDFFNAVRFLIYERINGVWGIVRKESFEKIIPSTPALTRKNTESLLPLIGDCEVIAGGALVGIPFTVFDRAGLKIFQVDKICGKTFDGIIGDIQSAELARCEKESVINETKPTEISAGIFELDLVELQRNYPEISSKMALKDFLENTAFSELKLACKHIPPWIELGGKYNIKITDESAGVIKCVITK